MSKHRHTKDKMHMTYTELREEKQKGKDRKKVPFEKLPFYCCGLSLAPFQDPVCTPDGEVFDILYIMPFIKKYQRNPISGKPLKPGDLIKMHWTRSQNQNNQYQFQDPISYKIFTQNSHIVCIKPSGYVYAYDTVKELNKKTKNYFDLVTNQPFTNEDIISIQDPKMEKQRLLQNFDHIKNVVPFIAPEKIQPEINQNQSINRVMEELNEHKKNKKQKEDEELQAKIQKKKQLESREDVKGFIQWCIQNKIYQHERESQSGGMSLTSTNFTPNINSTMTFRELKVHQIRQKIYELVRKEKKKGFVQICTNLGNMNFLVHCDLVPKTSENFIQLIESKYYDKTTFHRLVRNFCLQGGDPTGTGTGGQSIFGKPFEDQFHPKLTHSKTGILSMANSGPDTNTSQFFITLAQCRSLNEKHSVFGQIILNEELLHKINAEYTSKSEKPKYEITINSIYCYDNPFRKAIKTLKSQYEQKKKNRDEEIKQKEKQRWIQDSNKFSLPFISQEKKSKGNTLTQKLLEDYL